MANKDLIYKENITSILLLFLEIASEDCRESDNFELAYQKRLKFQKINDWKRFRASIDLLDDTENAILSAFRYQLGNVKSNNDSGEVYIRLYGILNAVYLQMQAYKELANLVNYTDRASIAPIFEKLNIYKLRNIAASHTVNYAFDKQDPAYKTNYGKTNTFRIIQTSLRNKKGDKIQVLDEFNNFQTFNLLEILTEYEKITTDLLVKIIHHCINTLCNNKEQKFDLRNRLKERIPLLIDYSKENKNFLF